MKLFVTLFVLLSLGAHANPCAQDTKKFCQGVDPGKGQIARCLSDYKDQLSPACAKELKKFKSKTAQKNPCHEELAEYCADIPVDPKKLQYCLIKHEDRLGKKCAADFKSKKSKLIVNDVCAQDITQHCYSEVKEPEGAINRCLIRHKPKLAPFCQKNIEKMISKMRTQNPCFDDTEKLCPTQVKFVEIQDCLAKKKGNLGLACKKLVERQENKMKSNPCYRDLITHCRAGISPDEQHNCLTVNERELSNACRQYRSREDDKIQKMVKACEADRSKLCKDVPGKDGKVLKCLRENKAKVSSACRVLI